MSLKNKILCLSLFSVVMALTPLAAQTVDPARASLFKVSLIVGGAVIALAVIAGAFGQSKAIISACEGISRNPAAGQNIRGVLIFGLVLIETLVIYALLITIIILMVKWGAY
ncbi:MAG: ATP synthase F0 subunit C [Candidatus Aminicenantes bacterium]|nr:ATP synthase F0 subunit C [Candidatus Aminicenantes bacterium]